MKYLKEATIFIFPSRIEGMSNMLLEAASMKCPIICSDIPANTDVFTDNEVTFFHTEDFIDLSKKITNTLNAYKLAKEKSENAYQKLRSNYLWEDIANKYNDLYQNIINK